MANAGLCIVRSSGISLFLWLNFELKRSTLRAYISFLGWIGIDAQNISTVHFKLNLENNQANGLSLTYRPKLLNLWMKTQISAGRNFVIGNALSDGCPIIYSNESFCKLTGWERHELVQKDCCCDFLYGPDTAPDCRQSITEALGKNEEYHTETYYYKKNGVYFLYNLVFVQLLLCTWLV